MSAVKYINSVKFEFRTARIGLEGDLNKAKALAVLHEICDSFRNSVSLTFVSLDAKQVECAAGAGYQIRMKCNLDHASRQCLEPILGEHKLVLKEEKGYIVICAS